MILLLESVLGFSVPAFVRRAAPGESFSVDEHEKGSLTDDIIHPVFQTKRDNSCPSGTYTAPNGLQFESFCLQNVPYSDIINTTADNMEDCMNQCAAFGNDNGETCWGVAYNFETQICFYKNQSILNTTPVKQPQTHSAFATNINTDPETACPWTNASDHSTPNGMDFEILCDQDMPFDDFCPWFGPTSTPPRDNGVCPYHADSLEECMELCSQTHPACKAVSYNPDMKEGYGNCYPKSDFSASTYSSSPATHMAVAAKWPTLNSSCTNGSLYTTPNNEQFTVSCNDNRPYNDLIQVHSANLSHCIDSCASYSNSTTGDCVAVVFDAVLYSGWQNCWLKSANGVAGTLTGFHYALKVGNVPTNTNGSSSGNNTSTGSNSTSSGSSSKAWIAGPVVGGIVGIALIGAGILYFFRQNKSKQKLALMPLGYEQQDSIYKQQPAYANIAQHAGDTNKPARHEADGLETQELSTENPTYELPANFVRPN